MKTILEILKQYYIGNFINVGIHTNEDGQTEIELVEYWEEIADSFDCYECIDVVWDIDRNSEVAYYLCFAETDLRLELEKYVTVLTALDRYYYERYISAREFVVTANPNQAYKCIGAKVELDDMQEVIYVLHFKDTDKTIQLTKI